MRRRVKMRVVMIRRERGRSWIDIMKSWRGVTRELIMGCDRDRRRMGEGEEHAFGRRS